MKIHLYGNVLNWAYQFGTYLRTLGHDVRVFVDARETSPLYQPAWEHGESRDLPDWIETVDVRFNLLHVFVPDGLLMRRCRGTRADIEALLTGPRGYVTPFYQTRNETQTETQLENAYLAKGLSLNSARGAAHIMARDPERARDTVVATVDARIVSEGDGDWDQGCRHVEARWQRFVNGRAAAWKSSENGSNR